MQPTLAAAEVKRNITQYLSTTFALADEPVRESLEAFFTDPAQGIFRGPYLRVRTPFRDSDDSWQNHLEWHPPGFSPFLHQAKAWERLSTLNSPAEPTLITTGTGSGKTESFLIPLLDHCRRERAAGNNGIKAVLLYPMNALATDQAQRLNELLLDPALSQVTAGLYIGDTPETGYRRVSTARAQIRRERPDILITNYKMLDLLLQREQDLPLWKDSALTYVVVDEFHTYDGAQGTDVAMLLRRLAAATGNSRPGHPLGDICPVATSATLGQDGPDTLGTPGTSGTPAAKDHDPTERIRAVASTVFGTEFGQDSVVGEDRLAIDEFMGKLEYELPVPDPVKVATIRDPHGDPTAMGRIMAEFTGRDDLTPRELGALLRKHILTKAVLSTLDGTVAPMAQVLDELPERGAYAWGRALGSTPELTAEALARYIALLSIARHPDTPEGERDRPLVTIETHLWVRSVSRLLRTVADKPSFAWHGETPPALGSETTTSDLGRVSLPAVYCRHCGRSGWAGISQESAPADLVTDPDKVYRGAIASKKFVRPLIRASRAEAAQNPAATLVLRSAGNHVRPVDPATDLAKHEAGQLDGVFVLADITHTKESFKAAENDRCPACAADQGTRFLGSGLAALASVSVTELFTGGQLAHDGETPKTLMFSDSVQDAAHRAGFVSNRSYTFSARALLAARLREHHEESGGAPLDLNDLIADTVARAEDPAYLACVVPPDMHDLPGMDRLLAGESAGGTREWDLVGERLAFTSVLEFGLRSRQGRTLELTRTAAAQVRLDHPDRIAALAADVLQHSGEQIEGRPSPAVFRGYVRGLLERLRTRGGISHAWLEPWIKNVGVKRFGTIWGKRPDGMPAFPRGLPAPRFLTDDRKDRSEFDSVTGRGTWYQDWTTRCLKLPPEAAPRYLRRLLELLHEEGVVTRTGTDAGVNVYGLKPGHVQVRLLDDEQVVTGGLRCHVCNWRQSVHPDQLDDWAAVACPRYRCTGHLTVDEDRRFRHDYYRRLYREAEPFRITTAEHTGQLTRAQRERVEESFKRGSRYTDPNVLSATPTLELGIDIGQLDAVVLGSLPTGPANYVQRAGRAGRRSGNAFLLTLVGRRARERYYLEEPLDMIAGQIAPPGSFPSAVEILRRQYAAHLLDLAARGDLPGVAALPGRAADLFGDLGWLPGFTESALAHGDRLVSGFLDLFTGPGQDVDDVAAGQLRHYATVGLKETVTRAEEIWAARLADLRERVETVGRSIDALIESDPEQKRRKRALQAERNAVRRRIGEVGRTSAHGALVDLGVLPNYSLVDSATELEATLTWEERDADSDSKFHTEVREYKRPTARALTELAPGNHYYVRGYRHTVDGLDIGSMNRPAWRDWRVCPACGYVRTHDAATNTDPCPRCSSAVIADRGSLYRVLEPTRVYARDRRDDALIRDEHDERQRVFYETATAVDIPEESIAPGAWRHTGRVFGVEFTREAVIRRFNLGALRMNRPATVTFAGNEVTPTPFQVCRACGGATLDEPVNAVSNVLGSSYDPSRSYHRPWCPQRRGDQVEHEKIVLAHSLRTEALRILLPVATVHTAERIISFKAALMAGLARVYGGALDHLAATVAAMPDHETGHQRRYLVIHDTLPGGSGYLNPRSGAEGIQEILTAAREVVAHCRCQADEGRAACHRCLLAHVSDREFPHADRALAEEMLTDLLEDWATDSIARTDDISLWDQVESELEARFLQALQRWAKTPDSGRSFELGGKVNGRRSAVLRLIGGDGNVIGWEVLFQNTIKGTRPDVIFRRLDTSRDQVALYLDGYSYHASAKHNRIADDADKRARLRAHGITVFQLNWDDLDHLDGKKVPHPAWLPYGPNGRMQAQQSYGQQGGDPKELDATVWNSPAETLFAYLGDPDPERWTQRSQAAVTGIMRTAGVENTGGGAVELAPHITSALRGDRLPGPFGGAGCVLIRGADDAGCRLVLVANQAERTVSAFTVLDDREETLAGGGDDHKRRWKAWLYWGNLVQFLTHEGGDGGQFALSTLNALDVSVLSAVGGDGLDSALALQAMNPAEVTDLFGDTLTSTRVLTSDLERGLVTLLDTMVAEETPSGPEHPGHILDVTVDPAWVQVSELMDPDEPGLETLAGELQRRGTPAPEVGYELGTGMWPAELAWPDHKVAVVLSAELIGNAEDKARGEAAYTEAGWHVREADQWEASELVRILTTGAESATGGHDPVGGDDDTTIAKG